ncbi:unnamed protein product [Urochloa humidicola]
MYAAVIALAAIISCSGVVDCTEVSCTTGRWAWGLGATGASTGHRAPLVPRTGARVRTPRRSASAACAASCAAPEDRPGLVETPADDQQCHHPVLCMPVRRSTLLLQWCDCNALPLSAVPEMT